MDRAFVARGGRGRDGETSGEGNFETREGFVAMSRFGANVQRPALNVQPSVQKMIEH